MEGQCVREGGRPRERRERGGSRHKQPDATQEPRETRGLLGHESYFRATPVWCHSAHGRLDRSDFLGLDIRAPGRLWRATGWAAMDPLPPAEAEVMEREADKEARRKIQFSVPSSVPTQLDPRQVEMVRAQGSAVGAACTGADMVLRACVEE